MGVREPTRRVVAAHADSHAWLGFARRRGDIVISTPPKSGTTWMQGIVASILWADGDIAGIPFELSPWLDVRRPPESDTLSDLAAQEHRRFITTHSPADAIPIDDECCYVTVHRDLRDVTMSWANHRREMRAELIELFNELAADDDVTPLAPVWDGDMDELVDEMRAASQHAEVFGSAFENGADGFFHRGVNRRWQGVLTDTQLERLAEMTAALPSDAAEWLEHGSLALGWRP